MGLICYANVWSLFGYAILFITYGNQTIMCFISRTDKISIIASRIERYMFFSTSIIYWPPSTKLWLCISYSNQSDWSHFQLLLSSFQLFVKFCLVGLSLCCFLLMNSPMCWGKEVWMFNDTLHSTILEVYRFIQFYWWMYSDYSKNTNDSIGSHSKSLSHTVVLNMWW